ncbi:MAG: cobalamin biosynthesis protein [Gammaproteobacteria bacterium]|uniref:Cobalamin biosynthesis protein n=1 Tax=Candidatus Thiopontia autotrophica TaxID=2841688 RepID=A0A8J6P690_9GAMM|nr:cobalamin biosynthesis protein [Candidatus Thiopontia autotrophica]
MSVVSPRVALIAITKHGVSQMVALAAKMVSSDIEELTVVTSRKFASEVESVDCNKIIYQGAMRAQMASLMESFDQLLFFVSLGAVVRLAAPHLKSKDEDPGIVVVDDAGKFVIPVLSGHVGGANEYAEKIASILQATAVVTTASDVGKTIPVDILGRELGWKIEAPKINITRVSADVVNEEPIAFVQEAGSRDWWRRDSALPANIHLFDSFEDVDLTQIKSLLWVTNQDIPAAVWDQLDERLVVYRPPRRLMLGVGCDRNTPLETVETALSNALKQINASHDQVDGMATIDKKSDEVALLQLADSHGWRCTYFSAEQLSEVEVPNPSDVVMKYMGTPAVAEAAAILAAETTMDDLLIEKYKYRGKDGKNATISVVEIKEQG